MYSDDSTAGQSVKALPCRSRAALGRQAATVGVRSSLDRLREHLYCPVSFNPGAFLSRADRSHNDSLVYLAHAIMTAAVRDRRDADRPGGWVRLKAEYLRNVIGRHRWPKVKSAALGCGAFECDPTFSPGVRSMKYRLRPAYADGPWALREIHDPGLIRRLRDWRERREREQWKRIRSGRIGLPPVVLEHLWGWLQQVEIDWPIPKAMPPEVAVSVDMIRRRAWFFICDLYSRLHHNVASLRRDLRRHVSIAGRPLVGCDIASSQPLFISLTLIEKAAKNSPREDGRGKGRRDGGGTREGTGPLGPLRWTRTPHKRDGIAADLAKWVELCEGGRLYRHVQDRLGSSLDYETIKRRVLATLFDKPWHRNRIHEVLWREFPSVMADVERIKAANYRHLAHESQRAEGQFVYGRVVRRLMEERPELPVLTIHDSVMTTVGNEDYVQEIMLSEFRKLGIEPTVRIEKERT